jgi:hypothetical protein
MQIAIVPIVRNAFIGFIRTSPSVVVALRHPGVRGASGAVARCGASPYSPPKSEQDVREAFMDDSAKPHDAHLPEREPCAIPEKEDQG